MSSEIHQGSAAARAERAAVRPARLAETRDRAIRCGAPRSAGAIVRRAAIPSGSSSRAGMGRNGIARNTPAVSARTAASDRRRPSHSAQGPGGGGVTRFTTISLTAISVRRSASRPSRVSSRDSASGSITHENVVRSASRRRARIAAASSSTSAMSASAESSR